MAFFRRRRRTSGAVSRRPRRKFTRRFRRMRGSRTYRSVNMHAYRFNCGSALWSGGFSTTIVGGGSINLNNSGLFTITSFNAQSMQWYSCALNFQQQVPASISGAPGSYDRYRIDKVVVRLIPLGTQAGEESVKNASTPQNNGYIHSVLDYDDNSPFAASEAGIALMRDRTTYRVSNIIGRRAHTWVIKRPRIAVAAYGSGVFTSYANQKAQWIDTVSGTVPHYGLKFLFQIPNPSADTYFMNFLATATYYMRFRDPL